MEDLHVHFPVRTGQLGGTKGVVKAVDGVSLTLNMNETLAVVGESGCGMTTMGNAVLGLIPITKGKVHLEGDDLSIHLRDARLCLAAHSQSHVA